MAVVNQYVNASYAANGLIQNPPGMLNKFRGGAGGNAFSVYETFNIAATDSSGSVYRILKSVDPNVTPYRISIANTAITGSTSFHLGLYLSNFGAIVGTGNQFVNAQSLAGARASLHPSVALDGLSAVPIQSYFQRLFEYAGQTTNAPTIATTRQDAFDICLTLNTSGGVAGTVSILMEFVGA